VHEHGHTRLGTHWFLSPKVILAFAAWAIFLVVLHTPVAPRLRGRKNAILSIVGLVLTIATLFAVLLMPKGVV
jgi:ABC-type transport system involved in cytochrome c biogenesis permease subunit